MKILVTGGSGFIGSHTVLEALRRGWEVDILDLTTPQFYSECNFIRWDITKGMPPHLDPSSYDVIVHACGILGVETTFDSVLRTEEVNVIGTLHLLEWIKGYNPLVIHPNLIGTWLNPYMISKHTCENYGLMYQKEYGVRYVSLRPMNVYGPGQGWWQKKIAPMYILSALMEVPIPVCGDGSTIVNMTYCRDVASAIVDLIEYPGIEGKIIEFPDPNGYMSTTEFAELVLKYTGSSAGIDYKPMRRGEPQATHVVADHRLADSIFSSIWRCKYEDGFTPLSDALPITIDWYRHILSLND